MCSFQRGKIVPNGRYGYLEDPGGRDLWNGETREHVQ